MQTKLPLLTFPLVTQGIFSLLAVILSGFFAETLGYVFIITALPAFLLAIVCVSVGYHRRQLLPITVWAGLISFIYGLVIISFDMNRSAEQPFSLWEQTIATFLFALSYAMSAMIYAIVVLRPLLPNKLSVEK